MAPIASLTIVVNGNITQINQSFTQLNQEVNNFHDNFKGMSIKVAAIGEFLGNVFYNLAKTIAGKLWDMAKDAWKFSNEYNAAIISLTGVARAFGMSSDTVLAAAQKLSADGLLPLKDSAASLRNLFMTGFNLEQSVKIMNAFKDSAVYARQSTYEYADSIRTATEGLKNTRSVQVDNVGLTKNLSVMMKEAGYQMQDLTDKNKGLAAREALTNAILRETAAQAGDAARSLGTVQGQLIAAKSAYIGLLAIIGDVVSRSKAVMLVTQAVGDLFRWLTGELYNNGAGAKFVSEALALIVRTASVVIKAVNALHTVFTDLDIALVSIVYGISKQLLDLTSILTQTIIFASKLPGGKALVGNYVDQVAALVVIQSQLEKITGATGKRIDANAASIVNWGLNTTKVTGQLDKLADSIDKADGVLLDLSASARPPGGTPFNPLGDNAEKNAKKIKKAFDAAWKEIKQLQDNIKAGIAMPTLQAGAYVPFDIKEIMAMVQPFGDATAAVQKLQDQVKLGIQAPKLTVGEYVPFDTKQIAAMLPTTLDPLEKAFFHFAEDIPGVIAAAIKRGDSVFGALAVSMAQNFGQIFARVLDNANQKNRKLTGKELALGYVTTGLEAAISGYSVGESMGTKKKGALGGAAAGAAAGMPLAIVTGGLSVAVGAGIGAISGFFGGRKAAKQAKQALADAKKAFIDQGGGMAKLQKQADELGVSLTAAFNAKNIDQFNAAVGVLNTALETQKNHLSALDGVMTAVNKRAENFGAQFKDLAAAATVDVGDDPAALEKKNQAIAKLAETAQRTQGEFERLSLMIKDTFAGIIANGGSAYAALTTMAPAFQVLQDGVSKWGLTSTAVIDELLADFQLVNDAGLKPLMENIQTSGQILQGLLSAKALSPEGFQAIAADIGASFQAIADKGGDMSRAMALSQPVLQSLWEAQQRYGKITDETTQSILTQAEEQGIVGESMKGVNDKILDVLLAIGKVLGADLPDYFNKLKKPADDAATSIETSFNGIKIDPIKVEYQEKWTQENQPQGPGGGSVPGGDSGTTPVAAVALARGGIVRRPTLALVGERGAEAVIPLTGSRLGLRQGGGTAVIEVEGRTLAEVVVPAMPGVIKRYGLGG